MGTGTIHSRLLAAVTLVLVLGAMLQGTATAARACTLDGTPSLSANGTLAGYTWGGATDASKAYWAPFTLVSTRPGAPLHLVEDLALIPRSVRDAALGEPFQWDFGDGTSALGQAMTHQYAHSGWYRITVRYAIAPYRRWYEFDSAQVQILPVPRPFPLNLLPPAGQGAQLLLPPVVGIMVAALALGARRLRRRLHS